MGGAQSYMNATLRRLPVTAVSQNPLATRRAVQTPKTDFLRSFFGGRSASPNTIMGAKPYILELDQVDDGADIQDALQEMTNQRSVPNVFINKKHMGGNSDLQAKKGELPQLLKDAKAI